MLRELIILSCHVLEHCETIGDPTEYETDDRSQEQPEKRSPQASQRQQQNTKGTLQTV